MANVLFQNSHGRHCSTIGTFVMDCRSPRPSATSFISSLIFSIVAAPGPVGTGAAPEPIFASEDREIRFGGVD